MPPHRSEDELALEVTSEARLSRASYDLGSGVMTAVNEFPGPAITAFKATVIAPQCSSFGIEYVPVTVPAPNGGTFPLNVSETGDDVMQ
jgi:hypothetical protein